MITHHGEVHATTTIEARATVTHHGEEGDPGVSSLGAQTSPRPTPLRSLSENREP